jgi:DNA-binding IclR family transcriptional regulator
MARSSDPTRRSLVQSARSTAPAVTRSAALLGLLAEPESGAMGPTEIARRLKLPKSTVANLCAALERAEFVRNSDGRYELGPRLLELSAAYLTKVDIFQEFHGTCRQLRWLSQEVVNMASLEDTDILVLARHYGSQSVMLSAGIGHRQPAYTTALGKAMLAQLDPADVGARYAGQRTFMVLTPNTKKNLAELMEDLDTTRERGYAIDHEENTLGLVSYAVALPGSNSGSNPRAVSVSLLKPRENDELRERLVEDMRELVDTLARHDRARHGPSGKA